MLFRGKQELHLVFMIRRAAWLWGLGSESSGGWGEFVIRVFEALLIFPDVKAAHHIQP